LLNIKYVLISLQLFIPTFLPLIDIEPIPYRSVSYQFFFWGGRGGRRSLLNIKYVLISLQLLIPTFLPLINIEPVPYRGVSYQLSVLVV